MRRALVVEDDPDIVELVTHYLAADGFTVDGRRRRPGALQQVRATAYELLILDLQLPGLDGLTLCAEVRRDPRPARPAHRDADRARRRDRPRRGPGDGRRRLRREAVQPEGAGGARARAVPAPGPREDEEAGRSRFGELEVDRARHTVRWAATPGAPHGQGVRAAGGAAGGERAACSRARPCSRTSGATRYAEGTRTVDVHVRRLREKMPGARRPSILTVKSLGYRLAREAGE